MNAMFRCGIGDKAVAEQLAEMNRQGYEAVAMHVTGGTMFILGKRIEHAR